MDENVKSEGGALAALRNFLSEQKLALNERLPAERDLCAELGLSRAKLRKALAILEAEGQIWRHVGRGTFIGPRPVLNLSDIEFLSSETSPTEVMEARVAVEPQLARLASLHGTEAHFAEMRRCNRRCRAAKGWRVYESWDNNFHQVIASTPGAKLRFRRAFAGLQAEHQQLEHHMMRGDARLGVDVCPPGVNGRAGPAERGILLTGGTGFFGPFLLRSLLEQCDDPVYVLVRARSLASRRGWK